MSNPSDSAPSSFSGFAATTPNFASNLRPRRKSSSCYGQPSHSLNELEFKLDEYVANGAKLGFLVYPPQQQVFVYRANQTPQCLQQPSAVPADPELPGLTLDLREIW